jgi:hypothetical protein
MTFDNLSQWFTQYVSTYPEQYHQRTVWRDPLKACATADERFEALKEIIVPDHALPQDLRLIKALCERLFCNHLCNVISDRP